MIDQARLDAIRLSGKPLGQRLLADLLLGPSFHFPLRRTHIVLQGEENLPRAGGAILVMNHTDRYNYWPLQYEMHRRGLGYTATWVKGKYYENPLLGRFMDVMNNIPLPSRGYLLTKDLQARLARLPTSTEYDALKRLWDGAHDAAAAAAAGGPAVAAVLASPSWRDDMEARFRALMARVVELNHEALRAGLNLLIFPEGTRSRRLGRGHTGAAQIAQVTRAPVIPVGCSGSDRCYPGNSPVPRGGTIVYRVGRPLTWDGALLPFSIGGRFAPFTADVDPHADTLQAMTDFLMDRINDLLDPEYQYGPAEPAEHGVHRFV